MKTSSWRLLIFLSHQHFRFISYCVHVRPFMDRRWQTSPGDMFPPLPNKYATGNHFYQAFRALSPKTRIYIHPEIEEMQT
jgi:hypothetical protein